MEGNTREEKIHANYNYVCGEFFAEQRKKRKISLKKIARGIMSSTALGRMESGEEAWKKFPGDVLMQRMGQSTEYFETYISLKELERWKEREEIVLFLLERPDKARQKICEYRVNYPQRNRLEKQFLLKMETILLIVDSLKKEVAQVGFDTLFTWHTYEDVFLSCAQNKKRIDGAEEILKQAQKAISQTVKENWMQGIRNDLLAPTELECFLLLIIGYQMNGDGKMAWQWWRKILHYVEGKEWNDYIFALILPQMGLVGMLLLQLRGEEERAYHFGKWALDSIRKVAFQNYAVPLLEQLSYLCRKHPEWNETECWGDYLLCFGELAERNQGIRCRLWQTVSITNTREIGVTLKMLREANGWTREKAADKIRGGLSSRQLARIESGENKPSFTTYQEIMRLYCREREWYLPLLETKDGAILAQRQQISTWIGRWELEKAEAAVKEFAEKIDMTLPRNRQQILLWETILQQHLYHKDLEVCLEQYKAALQCTLPNLEVENWSSWAFTREECICICNMANVLRQLGKLEEARQYYEMLYCSMKKHIEKSQIAPRSYEVLLHGYVGLLGDLKEFETARKMDEEILSLFSKRDSILYMESFFYDLAWCAYELQQECTSNMLDYKTDWKKNFLSSRNITLFIKDKKFEQFLRKRESKYLCSGVRNIV